MAAAVAAVAADEMRPANDPEKTGGDSLGPTATNTGAVASNDGHHGQARSDIVDFEGPDDPIHPLNWSRNKKLLTTALYSLTTMSTPFAGAIYSPAMDDIAAEFNVSKEVVTVGLSLCLLQIGPLIWAPLSEAYGRKWPVVGPCLVAAVFSLWTGAAKDIATVLVTRFITGIFGSAPVSNTGGVLADLWHPNQRGYAIMVYSVAVSIGPTIGPVVGGAMIHAGISWRWLQYLAGILQLVIVALDIVFISESSPQILLARKAARLRGETGNWALHTRHEEWQQSITFKYYVSKFAIRPFQMLATPICFSVALYASFIFGVIYATLAAFPVIYEEGRGWDKLTGSFPFLAMMIGILIGALPVMFNQLYYNRKLAEAGGHKGQVVPEARLLGMMFGSGFFAVGLFITGWTADPQYPWIASFIGITCFAFGYFSIFQSALNYLVDAFGEYGASAIAANTFLRSILTAVFPLFIQAMYHRLGVGWATSVFAFFATLLIPIPFVLWFFGERLRARDKYSVSS